MPKNLTNITLGECLSSANEIVRRNSLSILKQLQRMEAEQKPIKLRHNECLHQDSQFIGRRDGKELWQCNECGSEWES